MQCTDAINNFSLSVSHPCWNHYYIPAFGTRTGACVHPVSFHSAFEHHDILANCQWGCCLLEFCAQFNSCTILSGSRQCSQVYIDVNGPCFFWPGVHLTIELCTNQRLSRKPPFLFWSLTDVRPPHPQLHSPHPQLHSPHTVIGYLAAGRIPTSPSLVKRCISVIPAASVWSPHSRCLNASGAHMSSAYPS